MLEGWGVILLAEQERGSRPLRLPRCAVLCSASCKKKAATQRGSCGGPQRAITLLVCCNASGPCWLTKEAPARMTEFVLSLEPPAEGKRRVGSTLGTLVVPSAIALLALVLLAGPTLRQQAANLALPAWSRWHTTTASSSTTTARSAPAEKVASQRVQDRVNSQQQQRQQQQEPGRTSEQPATASAAAAAAAVVSDLLAWERQPGAAFLAPQSRCIIKPDGGWVGSTWGAWGQHGC